MLVTKPTMKMNGNSMYPADEQPEPQNEPTLVHNPVVAEVIAEMKAPLANVPWTLQQFFNGELDLDVELVKRFPNMPLLSTIHFRELGAKSQRGVATLSTQDGLATVLADVNGANKSVQFSFTYGSMLTLRFVLDHLSDMDRTRWLDLMRREKGGMAFLWSEARWRKDYIICIKRRYFTSLLAFSPHGTEAGARLTRDVTTKLTNWLEAFWKPAPEQDPTISSLSW